jgi:hypothetical protein
MPALSLVERLGDCVGTGEALVRGEVEVGRAPLPVSEVVLIEDDDVPLVTGVAVNCVDGIDTEG